MNHRGAAGTSGKTWTVGESVTDHVPFVRFTPPEKERKLYFP
jgi:hypothetical protein